MSLTLSSTRCKLISLPWRTTGSRPDGFWTWNNTGQGDASAGHLLMKGNMTGRDLMDKVISLESINAFSPDGVLATVGQLDLFWYMRSQSQETTATIIGADETDPVAGTGLFVVAPKAPRTPRGMISLGMPNPSLAVTTVYDVVGAAFSVNTNLINYVGSAFGYWWDRARIISEGVGLDIPYAG